MGSAERADNAALASVLMAPGELELQEFPVPSPLPGGALIRTEAAAICGSDVHSYRGRSLSGSEYPLIMGHENAGTVVELGEGVDRDWTGRPLKTGDRVISWQVASCYECHFCRVLGEPALCRRQEVIGYTFRADREPRLCGGYAQYLNLPNARFPLFKTELDPDIAVLAIPAGEALNTLETGGFSRGETVVVQGVGMQGLMCVAWARRLGAARVIAVGAPAVRLELADRLGAFECMNIFDGSSSEERVARVRELTPGGYGADLVLQCSGAPTALDEGLDCLRDGGRMVDMGHAANLGDFALDVARRLVVRRVHLLSGWSCTPERVFRALQMLESSEFEWEDLVSHRVSLSRLGEGLEAMEDGYRLDGREIVRVVVTPWE